MATDVIAWPPVGVTGSMWTTIAPVMRSRSMITGRRYVSRWERARIEAALTVSALSMTRSGAGYSEALIRLLDGGANLVRLNSYPINWHLDAQELEPWHMSQRLLWATGGNPLAWQDAGNAVSWFTGSVLSGTVAGNQLTVSGLPPEQLVARPSEFVELFADMQADSGQIGQVVTEARSNALGVAVLTLFEALTEGVYPRVNIGASDSRVFEVIEMPRAMQGVAANWKYPWQFREVFADEVGGFNEVNPW